MDSLAKEIKTISETHGFEEAVTRTAKLLALQEEFNHQSLLKQLYLYATALRVLLVSLNYTEESVTAQKTPLMLATKAQCHDVMHMLLETGLSNPLTLMERDRYVILDDSEVELDVVETSAALSFAIENDDTYAFTLLCARADHSTLDIKLREQLFTQAVQRSRACFDLAIVHIPITLGQLDSGGWDWHILDMRLVRSQHIEHAVRTLPDLFVGQVERVYPADGAKRRVLLRATDQDLSFVKLMYSEIAPSLFEGKGLLSLVVAACRTYSNGELYAPLLFQYVCVENLRHCERMIKEKTFSCVLNRLYRNKRTWGFHYSCFVRTFAHLLTVDELSVDAEDEYGLVQYLKLNCNRDRARELGSVSPPEASSKLQELLRD